MVAHLALATLLLGNVFSIIQEQNDTTIRHENTLNRELKNVEVVGRRVNMPLKGGLSTGLTWDMASMNQLPKIFGNADPIHYAQLLPGIQTCNEFDSGLYIQGCEQGQNYVSVSGVPVFNAAHLLGFFSIFNPTHFSSFSINTSKHSAEFPNRIGGMLDMSIPDSVPSRFNGDVSIGIMSSQGTCRIPLSEKSALFLSARSAYLNLLYGPLLKSEGSQIRYGFDDYNITYLLRATDKDIIHVNGYFGSDRTSLHDKGYQADTQLNWGNSFASLIWTHRSGKSRLETNLYQSYYHNQFELYEGEQRFSLPSHIRESGLKIRYADNHFGVGIEAALRDIQPQSPKVEGTDDIKYKPQPAEHTEEYATYINYTDNISRYFIINVGARLSLYHASDNSYFFASDPSASLSCILSEHSRIRLSCGFQHQYISQTGFTSAGLPTEFWYSSDKVHRPQSARYISASYEASTPDNEYQFYLELYDKRLRHQEEYNGDILDLMTADYQFDNMMLQGDGRNYGINVMMSKRKGPVTGWISYGLGKCRRTFDGETYSASHERVNELNAVATYHLQERWDFSATMVYASGTPFTAPESFYMINNHLISQYGAHNACHLNPYFRVDVSANYYFRNRQYSKSGINLSLYNVTMHKNDIYYRLKFMDGDFAYKPLRMFITMIPSISYFIKF